MNQDSSKVKLGKKKRALAILLIALILLLS